PNTMMELFNNAAYDFIGRKKYFVSFSIIISLMGIVSFFVKGFNLGIDFSGGTLVNVRFKKPIDDIRLRKALADEGIDITKVTIQPIGQLGETPKNETLIRMPQTFANERIAGGIDADKRLIAKAIDAHYSGTTAEVSRNRVDVNNCSRDAIQTKLLDADSLGYKQSIGEIEARKEYEKFAIHITDYRDKVRGGLIGDISEIPLGGLSPQFGDALK